MRTSSCKAKGRRACAEAKELLERYAPHLKPGDIRITSSGAQGEDLQLSPAAAEVYPFAIECKNVEKLNIWGALDQAQRHADKAKESHLPLLIFRRNRSRLFVALEAEAFLKLIGRSGNRASHSILEGK